MCKRILYCICLLCISVSAKAQLLSTSATITDSDGTAWNGLTWTVQLISPNGKPFYNGTALSTTPQTGVADANGTFAVSLYTTATVTPTGAFYAWILCSKTSAPCSSFQTSVATTNLTSLLSAQVLVPRFPASSNAYGYADVEVSPTPLVGQGYYNIINSVGRQWNGSAFVNSGAGGSGTITTGTSGQTPYYTGTGTTLGPSSESYIVTGNSLYKSVVGSSFSSFWGIVLGLQEFMGFNELFTGGNWVYDKTGFSSSVRLGASGAGGQGFMFSACPTGTAGATITTHDSTCIKMLGVSTIAGIWANPGSANPSGQLATDAIVANSGRTFVVDSSGNTTANTLALLTTVAATCTSAIAGQFQYTQGNASTKDIVEVCAHDASNVYAWRAIY